MSWERYIERSPVIQAIQYTQETRGDIIDRLDDRVVHQQVVEGVLVEKETMMIRGSYGAYIVPGDWVVIDENGQIHCMNNRDFNLRFERYV